MRNFALLTLISAMLVFSSCEGNRTVVGIMRDSRSGLTISGVKCESNSGNFVYSDSVGHFNLSGPFGSCIFGCKDLKVTFSHDLYKTKTVVNPPNDNIFLDPE